MDWGSFFAENGAAIFWLLVAVLAAVVESFTCDLVALWFVPGALVAMLLSMFVDLVWIQIAIFLLLSIVMLILTKTVLKKHLPQAKTEKMNADSLIGQHGVVIEEINNIQETGSVKIKGLVWTARTTNDSEVVPPKAIVTVCGIEGVKLICQMQKESKQEIK